MRCPEWEVCTGLIPALYQNIGKCQEPLGHRLSHESRFSNELDLVRDIQGHPGNKVRRTENHGVGGSIPPLGTIISMA